MVYIPAMLPLSTAKSGSYIYKEINSNFFMSLLFTVVAVVMIGLHTYLAVVIVVIVFAGDHIAVM